jgi:TRAP-type transport system periplasmic protein
MKGALKIMLMSMVLVTMVLSTVWGQTIKLTYNGVWPDSMIGGKAQREWCEEVTKRSGGRVKIEYYPDATLYAYNPSESALAQGTIDFAQFPGQTMVFTSRAIELPFFFDTMEQMKQYFEKGGMEIIAKEAATKNMKPLWTMPFGSHAAIFRKAIVRTMEDLKGLKLRSPTPQLIDFLGRLGAANVNVAVGEVYQALQLGTIDGVLTTTETFVNRKWYEAVSYFLDNRFATSAHISMANLQRWNSLPPDIQKIMLDVGKEQEKKMYDVGEKYDQEVRAKLRQLIKTTYTLPPQELERWREKAMETWAAWAKQGPLYVEALELGKKIRGEK